MLPKDKGLFKIEGSSIEGDSVKKVVVKANISTEYTNIIPYSTVEASFKGSDTSNVTDMSSMFYGCSSLTSLDLSGWNMSNVTSMHSMFYNCNGLKSLDLSSFNTSNVTDMASMFSKCSCLTSLDLSGWDTSKVTDMTGMFSYCSALKEIKMIGCTQPTIDKIKAQLTTDGITGATIDDGKTRVTITQ